MPTGIDFLSAFISRAGRCGGWCRAASAMKVVILLGLPLNLYACATVRLHTDMELSAVGRSCGFAPGEVVQETEEPRLLFLYSVAPPRDRLACIARWSRRHALHLVYVQAVNGGSR
jgi:hypothetical protein